MDIDRTFTVAEAAMLLKRSEKAIRRLLEKGHLTRMPGIDKRVRISAAEIDRALGIGVPTEKPAVQTQDEV